MVTAPVRSQPKLRLSAWIVAGFVRFVVVGLLVTFGVLLIARRLLHLPLFAIDSGTILLLIGMMVTSFAVGLLLIALSFAYLKFDKLSGLFDTALGFCGAITAVLLWSNGKFDIVLVTQALLGMLLGWMTDFVLSTARDFARRQLKKGEYYFAVVGISETVCPLVGAITCYAAFTVVVRHIYPALTRPGDLNVPFALLVACSISAGVALTLTKISEY